MHPRLIFLHLPKTGGTSLTNCLRQIYDTSEFAMLSEMRIGREVRSFIQRPTEELAAIRAVCGHIPYGIAQYMPGASVYATLLREPIDRVLSDYFYCARAPQHPFYEPIRSGQMDLEVFNEVAMNNVMTRRLQRYDLETSKEYWLEDEDRPLSDKFLDTATQTLTDHVGVVGLQNQFDNFINRLSEKIGMPIGPIDNANATDNRPQIDDLPSRMVTLLRDKNIWDIELYKRAEALVEQQAFDFQHANDAQRRTTGEQVKS